MHLILLIGIAHTATTLLWIVLTFKLMGKTTKLSNKIDTENHLRDVMIGDIQHQIDEIRLNIGCMDDEIYKTQKEVVKLIPPSFDEVWKEKKRQRETGALDIAMPLPGFPSSCDKEKETFLAPRASSKN